MLDVHPPHQKIHGASDFFLHLLTITIGLLIALGLEASVEALHHRHQRIEAETTIREELQQNRDTLRKLQSNIVSEKADMTREMTVLEDLRDGKQDSMEGLNMSFNTEPLHSAAWSSASTTGAVNYIPYATVQQYAEAYQIQASFERSTDRNFLQYEDLYSYVVKQRQTMQYPKPQDVDAALREAHLAAAGLNEMQDIARGALEVYGDVLK